MFSFTGDTALPPPDYECYNCHCTESGWVWCNFDESYCPPLKCAIELIEPGDGPCICATCRHGCGYNGIVYEYGWNVPVSPCATCTCKETGIVSCTKNACPALPCSEDLRETPEGECCERCKPGAPTLCFFDGQQYEVGQPVEPRADTTTCTACFCKDDGMVACSCERPKCPLKMQEKPDGECCKRCKPGTSRDCFINGHGYDAGEELGDKEIENIRDTYNEPCIGKCICGADGGYTCYYRDPCPTLECDRSMRETPAGECCEVCKE